MKNIIDFNAKDSITVGIFTALIITLQTTLIMLLHFLPGALMLFKEALVVIITGPVYVVLWTKVPKKGVFLVCAAATALVFSLFGFFTIGLFTLLGGLVADQVAGYSQFKNFFANSIAYVIFSLFKTIGTYIPFYLWGTAFTNELLASGNASQEFVNIFTEQLTWRMGVYIMLANGIAAALGSWAGYRMLRKHFR